MQKQFYAAVIQLSTDWNVVKRLFFNTSHKKTIVSTKIQLNLTDTFFIINFLFTFSPEIMCFSFKIYYVCKLKFHYVSKNSVIFLHSLFYFHGIMFYFFHVPNPLFSKRSRATPTCLCSSLKLSTTKPFYSIEEKYSILSSIIF